VPSVPKSAPRRNVERQKHDAETALDVALLDRCRDAILERRPQVLRQPLSSVHRAVGTTVGSEITRQWGSEGLPDDTIRLECTGSAGQSFGAFVPRGLTLTLEGDANDYVGKGLSGGRIIVRPPSSARFDPADNVIVGNVAFYGATSGEAYISGVAGERFAVRNSGAVAVVEGVGDHGCEYMTGGCVIVLGRTGRNFAAGMTGGIAVAFDPAREFADRCNVDTVDLEHVGPEDEHVLHALLSAHVEHTASRVAFALLADWPRAIRQFVKVVPREYKRAVAGGGTVGLSRTAAVLVARRSHDGAADPEVMYG
jgi:glutamate synthase (ferredoxin)